MNKDRKYFIMPYHRTGAGLIGRMWLTTGGGGGVITVAPITLIFCYSRWINVYNTTLKECLKLFQSSSAPSSSPFPHSQDFVFSYLDISLHFKKHFVSPSLCPSVLQNVNQSINDYFTINPRGRQLKARLHSSVMSYRAVVKNIASWPWDFPTISKRDGRVGGRVG